MATMDYSTYGKRPRAFTPGATYKAGEQVVSPLNKIVSAKIDFIAGASYLQSDWNDRVLGTTPTLAAGPQAGTSPPPPVLQGGSDDSSGSLTFGTGTTPAAGNLVTVTFGTPLSVAPTITLTPVGGAAAGLQLFVQNISTSGFSVAFNQAPAASQPNTQYGASYRVN